MYDINCHFSWFNMLKNTIKLPDKPLLAWALMCKWSWKITTQKTHSNIILPNSNKILEHIFFYSAWSFHCILRIENVFWSRKIWFNTKSKAEKFISKIPVKSLCSSSWIPSDSGLTQDLLQELSRVIQNIITPYQLYKNVPHSWLTLLLLQTIDKRDSIWILFYVIVCVFTAM